jgi:hypothetical protein
MKNFDRAFGIELEVIGGENVRPRMVADALNLAGVLTAVEGYNHQTRNHWKIVSDASLRGTNAMELVSPILNGEEGLAAIRTVCAVLNQLGVTVNKSCGFHVHVDARNATVQQVKNLLRVWAKYEAVHFEALPASRRDAAWCRPVFGGLDLNAAWNLIEQRALETMARYGQNMSGATFGDQMTYRNRYYALNLTAMARHGTAEFRSHSGTTDADKIVAWVKLCVMLVCTSFECQRPNKIGAGRYESMIAELDAPTRRYFVARRERFAGGRSERRRAGEVL